MAHLSNQHRLRHGAFFLCLALLVVKATVSVRTYPAGDGIEYILMTEAMSRGLRLDVTAEDAHSFKEAYTAVHPWERLGKAEHFDRLIAHLEYPDKPFMSQFEGLFVAKDGKNYGYHFWFYSATAVPARWATMALGLDPIRAFFITNVLLALLACWLLLYHTFPDARAGSLAALLFVLSPVFWYLNWPHPETYTMALTVMGLALYFRQGPIAGIGLLVLAGLQNQPLAIIIGLLSLHHLFRSRFRLAELAKLAALGVVFLIPSAFYYYHYGVTSLISGSVLDPEDVTPVRVWGFFFDLNQGMVVAYPLLLFAYLFLAGKEIWGTLRRRRCDLLALIPFAILGIVLVVSTMHNWNHGMVIVNRYVTYIGAIMLAHLLYLIAIRPHAPMLGLMAVLTATQALAVIPLNYRISVYDWSQLEHRTWARWALEHHPRLYNPDYQIFFVRTAKDVKYNYDPSRSPFAFTDRQGRATKVMVHISRLDGLRRFGYSDAHFEQIAKQRFHRGWTYLHGDLILPALREFIFVDGFQREQEARVLETMESIRENEGWMRAVEEKAAQWGLPVDSVLRLDAIYTVEQTR